ncbi:substrate-binding domain-containing protein [Citrobacter sp. JGM124]|uniref:substrate-binding domain-containing protein n=1 Tax=Citrobacter sp. JGM124 TaxID=2799789 RepID=UPI001BAA0C75|nr:substrate-binding domain-containing protein [Citrobacter sp. JGM124]MBS0849153.1 substrate-binding domain-containing protein [Citrobacter sp. JGM124]
MRKVTYLITTLAMAISAFSFSANAEPKGKDAPVTILVSALTYSFPHFVFLQEQLEDEAKTLGNVKVIRSDGQLSAPKQIADIEAAIVQGVDGIIIAPADATALAPVIRTAIKEGIPVVTIDRPVNGVPEVLANVAADNLIGAQHQGEAVEKLFPEGATIINLQGIPGDKTANDRNKGVHDALDKHPELYKFVAEQTARFNRDQGLSVTENLLTGLATPPTVIIAGNDDSALGAAQAVEARGLKGKIAIFGYDGSTDALKGVRDGVLTATVDQYPGKQGREAVKIITDYIRNGVRPATSDVLISPVAITNKNLNDAERIGLVK